MGQRLIAIQIVTAEWQPAESDPLRSAHRPTQAARFVPSVLEFAVDAINGSLIGAQM